MRNKTEISRFRVWRIDSLINCHLSEKVRSSRYQHQLAQDMQIMIGRCYSGISSRIDPNHYSLAPCGFQVQKPNIPDSPSVRSTHLLTATTPGRYVLGWSCIVHLSDWSVDLLAGSHRRMIAVQGYIQIYGCRQPGYTSMRDAASIDALYSLTRAGPFEGDRLCT